jgi:hypothetical protein
LLSGFRQAQQQSKEIIPRLACFLLLLPPLQDLMALTLQQMASTAQQALMCLQQALSSSMGALAQLEGMSLGEAAAGMQSGTTPDMTAGTAPDMPGVGAPPQGMPSVEQLAHDIVRIRQVRCSGVHQVL